MDDLLRRVNLGSVLLEAESERVLGWRRMIIFQEENQTKLQRRLESFLRRQVGRLIDRINIGNWRQADMVLGWQNEAEALAAVVRPYWRRGYMHGKAEAEQAVDAAQFGKAEGVPAYYRGDALLEQDEFVLYPEVIAAIENALEELTTLVNQTTRQNIQAILRQAVDEGWDVKQLQQQILGQMAGIEPIAGMDVAVRAEMIAMTEMVRALNAGARTVYEQSGFLNDMNQQFTVRSFDSQGNVTGEHLVMHPPAHPRCRCTLALNAEARALEWIAVGDASTCGICADLEAESERNIADLMRGAA